MTAARPARADAGSAAPATSPASGASLGASPPGLSGAQAAAASAGKRGAHSDSTTQVSGLVSAPPALAQRDASDQAVAIPQPTKTTSASAAFTRSLLLFMGFLFRRPSKLFRPNRLDTWAGLRRLAESADQNLSPTFVRSLFNLKGGPIVIAATLLPPLVVNTTLGFLLFSSHSLISLGLARMPYFHRGLDEDDETNGVDDLVSLTRLRDPLGPLDGDYGEARDEIETEEEEEITLETIIRGPRVIPKHPTLLSAIAGAGAGVIQGMAFTPIENVVRLLQQSASSITSAAARFLHLPTPKSVQVLGPAPSSPIEALKSFFAHETWHKSRSWWTGWRWAVMRDAYSIFFATFDVTRRVGLRVKSVMSRRAQRRAGGGESTAAKQRSNNTQEASEAAAAEEHAAMLAAAAAPPRETPTSARLAQAGTIVFGGIAAAHLAELSGRPFRACQRVSGTAATERAALEAMGRAVPERFRRPIAHAYAVHGPGFFLSRAVPLDQRHREEARAQGRVGVLRRVATRAMWRIASVGPWGLGFLMFAWIGGEV